MSWDRQGGELLDADLGGRGDRQRAANFLGSQLGVSGHITQRLKQRGQLFIKELALLGDAHMSGVPLEESGAQACLDAGHGQARR
jgi:hypothetical protein